jgi:hypothetical protein
MVSHNPVNLARSSPVPVCGGRLQHYNRVEAGTDCCLARHVGVRGGSATWVYLCVCRGVAVCRAADYSQVQSGVTDDLRFSRARRVCPGWADAVHVHVDVEYTFYISLHVRVG